MDLTNCELNKWYDIVRIETMSEKFRIRMAHLGLNKRVKVLKRLNHGPVTIKTSYHQRKTPPLILGHGLAMKVLVAERTDHDGDASVKIYGGIKND